MAIKNSDGWWQNAKGEFVHKDLVKVTDQIKDDLVERAIADSLLEKEKLKIFKHKIEEEIEEYFNLLLQNYKIDEKNKHKKGNFTLENFSATKKIEVRVAETLKFDEKIHIAKIKIDEFLKEATKGASIDIQTLITKAFEVDKEGNIDAKKIFSLRAYEISNPKWLEAMAIIDESKQVASTKSYIRFYSRDNIDEPYKLVNIDFASA